MINIHPYFILLIMRIEFKLKYDFNINYSLMFNKSIVIVDDDPDLVNVYSDALKMSGYDVSSFTDPYSAYQYIKENLYKYSLVITDDKMPNMSGLFLGTM
jgi:DNA-binding NtrC family response regulator